MLPTGGAFLLHEGKPEDGRGPNSGGTSKWSRVEVREGQMAFPKVASDSILGGLVTSGPNRRYARLTGRTDSG
jgi:hypothetical protein